jgi:hypothetical protein
MATPSLRGAIGESGKILTGEEKAKYAQKNGLCPICLETQTHDRTGRLLTSRWVPKDDARDAQGTRLVYKGYCLKPTCFTMREAKIRLGESAQPTRPNHEHDPISDFLQAPPDPTNNHNYHHPHEATVEFAAPPARLIGQRKPASESDIQNMMDDILNDRQPDEAIESFKQNQKHHKSSPDVLGVQGTVISSHKNLLNDRRGRGGNGNQRTNDIARSLHAIPVQTPELTAREQHSMNDSTRSLQGPPPHRPQFTEKELLPPLAGRLDQLPGKGRFGNVEGEEKEEEDSEEPHEKAIRMMKEAAEDNDFTLFLARLETASKSRQREAVLEGLLLLSRAVRDQQERTDPRLDVFGTDTWVKNINVVIEHNEEDEEIMGVAVSTYSALSAISKRYMCDIVHHGGAKSVISIMERFTLNSWVVDRCCCSLFYMVDTEIRAGEPLPQRHRRGLLMCDKVATKLIVALVTSLRTVSAKGKSWVFDSLSNLMRQNIPALDGKSAAEHIRDAADGQGISILVDAMKLDASYIGLASSSLNLLHFLLADEAIGGSLVIACDPLMSAVVAFTRFTPDESILQSSFTFLGSLCSQASSVSAINLKCYVECASDALSNFPNCKALQLAIIESLVSVLHQPEKRAGISAWDTLVGEIVSTMNSLQQDVELQSLSCHALATIASGSDAGKVSLVNNGAVTSISRAALYHLLSPRNPETSISNLRLNACTVAASLASSPSACSLLTDRDVFSVFMDVVQSAPVGSLSEPLRIGLITSFSAGAQLVGIPHRESRCHTLIESLMKAESREGSDGVLSSILGLCQNSPVALTSLVTAENGEGLNRIVDLMVTHMASPSLIEAACGIFTLTYAMFPFRGVMGEPTQINSRTTTFSIVVHSENHIKGLRRALSMLRAKKSVVENATVALSLFLTGPIAISESPAIVFEDDVKRLFSGALRECMDVMAIHPDDLDIQNRCLCYMRCLLLLGDDMEIRRLSSFILDRTVTAFRAHSGDEELKINVCSILVEISHQRESDSAFGSMDGHLFTTLLLDCMRSKSEALVDIASRILATVLPRVLTLVGYVVDIPDSMEVIVGLLFQYPRSTTIVSSCCAILASVTSLHDIHVVPLIADVGGVQAILDVMDEHQGIDAVQENSCKVLATICKGISRDMLMRLKSSFGSSVSRAMLDNVANADAQSAILEIIWNLCSRDDFFKEYFTGTNAILTIVEVMDRNLYDRNVQGGGCAALWSLASFNDNKRLVGECGGLRVIVNALLAHLEAARIQKEGLTALKNLATTSRNKQRIRASGGEAAILCSMRFNMKSEEILSAAFSALNNIAVDSDARTVAQVPREVFECILLAMKTLRNSESVQKNACFLLKSYTFSPSNLNIMRSESEEFTAALTWAADRFPAECLERANYIIGRLYEVDIDYEYS